MRPAASRSGRPIHRGPFQTKRSRQMKAWSYRLGRRRGRRTTTRNRLLRLPEVVSWKIFLQRVKGLCAARAQAPRSVKQRKRGLSFSSSLAEDELSQQTRRDRRSVDPRLPGADVAQAPVAGSPDGASAARRAGRRRRNGGQSWHHWTRLQPAYRGQYARQRHRRRGTDAKIANLVGSEWNPGSRGTARCDGRR
jgi:hypothetical protein